MENHRITACFSQWEMPKSARSHFIKHLPDVHSQEIVGRLVWSHCSDWPLSEHHDDWNGAQMTAIPSQSEDGSPPMFCNVGQTTTALRTLPESNSRTSQNNQSIYSTKKRCQDKANWKLWWKVFSSHSLYDTISISPQSFSFYFNIIYYLYFMLI